MDVQIQNYLEGLAWHQESFVNCASFKPWSHANVSQQDKLTCFNSFVVSRLLYALSTMQLVRSQRRRLDGFYARCLRRVLHIPAAFVSRISNSVVFKRASVQPITEQLLRKQLVLFQQVATAPQGDPLRRDTFVAEGMDPMISHFIRRVGRPRLDWTQELLREGSIRFGSYNSFHTAVQSSTKVQWRQELDRIFSFK